MIENVIMQKTVKSDAMNYLLARYIVHFLRRYEDLIFDEIEIIRRNCQL